MKELPVNQIICGDALEVIKTWPAESIDMCMTSPPYWGLRDYGIEQIFGGDKDCEHEWGDDIPFSGQKAGNKTLTGKEQTYLKQNIQFGDKGKSGNVCLKCHAWKGQLGLESTPELYIEHLTGYSMRSSGC